MKKNMPLHHLLLRAVFFLGLVGPTYWSGDASAQAQYHIGCTGDDCEVQSWSDDDETREFYFFYRNFDDPDVPLNFYERIRYRRAMKVRPDVSSCLLDEERSDDLVDLTKVDWSRFNNRYNAEICFARIGHIMPDYKHLAGWFEAVGFKATTRKETASFPNSFSITAIWAGDDGAPEGYVPMWFGLLDRLLYIVITFHPDRKITRFSTINNML